MRILSCFQIMRRVVPAGLAVGVMYQPPADSDNAKPQRKWVLREEKTDAGGLDEKGHSKRRRSTGAITVDQGSGTYILRFRLLPGSLATDVQYRVALVPPSHNPPLWLMQESEVMSLGDSKDQGARSLTFALLVAGLLEPDDAPLSPGIFADQFSTTVARLNEFSIEAFALRWESQQLHDLSVALQRLVGSVAMSIATQQGARMVLPTFIGAISLPITVVATLRTMIDNVWATTLSRARSCGYMLATELAARSFGCRPIVLAGYSCGALVIFSCLQELARRKLYGVVHDVFLIGAPCTADSKKWKQIRQVVSGRLVNAYLPGDWYLELFHRSAGGESLVSVAGTRPVRDSEVNVENCDLSDFNISSHLDYANRISEILVYLGLGDGEKKRYWQKSEPEGAEGAAEDNVGTEDGPSPGLVPPTDNTSTAKDSEDELVVAFDATTSRSWRRRFNMNGKRMNGR